MTPEKLLDYIAERNYEAVENALQNGFDANTLLQNDTTGIQWASYTDDFRMIEIFWKHGAKPTTEYIEDIVTEFEKGKTYLDLKEAEENPGDYPDLTNDFSVTKWEILKGQFKIEEENYYCIVLPVSKFVLDDEIISTSINLYAIELPETLHSYVGKTISFPVNPNEGYIDGSVFLRNAHNPVDVTEIRFLKLEKDFIELELTMMFDFEYEDIGLKNETTKYLVQLVIVK
ncbi:hypothetical protein V1389_15245 [Flavobacterium rakeshii]|uniref:hypothetical protein n=1 Tax=Flavobacterium rakeshii TaxID=1038845 RepID=UPI002E7C18D1|nr:hypothetical protein [Flavobacterium rakeshii]MEE1899701.1 hypothetical protein [Flavobacterium rakeshii]